MSDRTARGDQSTELATAPTVAEPLGSDRTFTDPGRPSRPPARELPTIDPTVYELGEEVAHGGMGRIRAAYDLRLGREVAIKELLEPRGSLGVRFEREALVTARLQHPSIVAVYEAGRWPSGEPFYAMRLVRGRSLKRVISDAGSFDGRLALLPHVIAVADAIAYAHGRRVVHRDLKPSNVLVGDFGETVVIDWGIAKDLDAEDAAAVSLPGKRSSDASLTHVGDVLGTPSYMAPEQARGEPIDERADVYAIGAMLYHLLAGVPPYVGEDSAKLVERVAREPPPDLGTREPRIAADLLAIVARAMARGPKERYPSARELVDDLRQFQTGRLVGSHRYSRRELMMRFVRRHRVAVAISAVAALVLAVFGAIAIQQIRSERDTAQAHAQRADEQHKLAEERGASLVDSSDEAMLRSANGLVRDDPWNALAVLSRVSAGTKALSSVRFIASDARARRIPKLAAVRDIVHFARSVDGTKLASAGGDHAIWLWDAATLKGRAIGTHGNRAQAAAFSPDGTRLVTVGMDRKARLWGLDGSAIAELDHPDLVSRVAYALDGSSIATLADDQKLRVWDVATRTVRVTVPADGMADITYVDATTVLYAGYHQQLELIDARTGTRTTLARGVTAFAWTLDGKLAYATASGDIVAWDPTARRPQTIARVSRPTVIGIAAGGAQIATFSSLDRRIRIHSRGRPDRVLGIAEGDVSRLVIADDATMLASIGSKLTMWNLATGDATMLDVTEVNDAMSAGPHLVVGGEAGLEAWPWANGERVVLAPTDGAARQIAFLRDGQRVVVGSDGRIQRVGERALDLPPIVGRFALHPTRAELAAIGADGRVRIAPLDGGPARELAGSVATQLRDAPASKGLTFQHAGGGTSAAIVRASRYLRDHAGWFDNVAYSPDGAWLVAADLQGGKLHVWELATGDHRLVDVGRFDIEDLAFASATVVLVAGGDGAVHVVDAATGAQRELPGHEGAIEGVVALPDGRIATAGEDHTIRTWDLASGRELEKVVLFEVMAQLAYSPTAKLLIAADVGGRVYHCDPSTLSINRITRVTGRIVALAVSPDGRTLAVGSSEQLDLVDLAGGASRTLGRGHAFGGPAFSPDGREVAAAVGDGSVRAWPDDLPRDEAGLRAWIERQGVKRGQLRF